MRAGRIEEAGALAFVLSSLDRIRRGCATLIRGKTHATHGPKFVRSSEKSDPRRSRSRRNNCASTQKPLRCRLERSKLPRVGAEADSIESMSLYHGDRSVPHTPPTSANSHRLRRYTGMVSTASCTDICGAHSSAD